MSSLNINYSSAISAYQQAIFSLIQGVGQNHLLLFESSISQVNDGFNDIIREDARLTPSFKSTTGNLAPSTILNGYIINGLIKNNPTDFDNQDGRINVPQVDIRLKTSIEAANSIQRCKYVIPNVNIASLGPAFLNTPIQQNLGNIQSSGTNFLLWSDQNAQPFCYIYAPIETKFQLSKPPTSRGLGEQIFLYSYWKQIA